MNNVIITVIGAGSAVFSMKIVSDACKTQALKDSTIRLMDIDEKRLRNVHFLAEKLNDHFGTNTKFEIYDNLEKAIEGADFVINTAMAGGHEFLEKVRAIGEKYGYYRGIDAQAFNMVSDYYNLSNWNQLGLMLKVAKIIEEKSPNAWLLQAANPVLEGTTLISRETNVKMVGFCHGHHAVNALAEFLRVKEFEWEVAGVNHGIWLTKFTTKDGKDLYPLLKEKLKFFEEKPHVPQNPFDDTFAPVALDLFNFYGLYPIGDTIRNTTWKYHRTLEDKLKWYGKPFGGADSEIGWKWYQDRLKSAVEAIDTAVNALKMVGSFEKILSLAKNMGLTEFISDLENLLSENYSGEQHIPFINSVITGKPDRFVVNVLNKGKIPLLPDDIAVEIGATVSGENFEFEKPQLPKKIVDWYLKPRCLLAEYSINAFLKKDINLVKEVLERDPRTKSSEQVEKVVNEIFVYVRTLI